MYKIEKSFHSPPLSFADFIRVVADFLRPRRLFGQSRVALSVVFVAVVIVVVVVVVVRSRGCRRAPPTRRRPRRSTGSPGLVETRLYSARLAGGLFGRGVAVSDGADGLRGFAADPRSPSRRFLLLFGRRLRGFDVPSPPRHLRRFGRRHPRRPLPLLLFAVVRPLALVSDVCVRRGRRRLGRPPRLPQ